MEWVASTLTPPPNVVYPALLKLMHTPDEIWFLRVCHHVPHELYSSDPQLDSTKIILFQ